MSTAPDWKSALYSAYVSTGPASSYTGGSAEEFFRSRLAFLHHIVAEHMPQDRNARIIDLGCGPGALLYALDCAGYRNIAGVDISQEQIDIATSLGITSATCGTLDDLLAAQPPESVDAVLAIDILEHFTRPDVMELLASIRRVIKPGGRCVAHVPNAEGLYGAAIRYGDFTHETSFTRGSAAQVFRAAGFTEVRCFEDRPNVHGLKSLVRRIIWDAGTIPSRLLHLAETGAPGAILSQNMLIEARV